MGQVAAMQTPVASVVGYRAKFDVLVVAAFGSTVRALANEFLVHSRYVR